MAISLLLFFQKFATELIRTKIKQFCFHIRSLILILQHLYLLLHTFNLVSFLPLLCFSLILPISLKILFLVFSELKLIFVYYLKLVPAIFLFFHQMTVLQKLWKILFISSKKLFSFWTYSNICTFSLLFHTFQIQKDKWIWNNLWCHELACRN